MKPFTWGFSFASIVFAVSPLAFANGITAVGARGAHAADTFASGITTDGVVAAEVYKCVSKDAETGYSIAAEVTIRGAAADLKISASGLPGCRSVPAMAVTGQKPVLNLSGTLVCDGEEPEDVTMVLNTSKKTLSLADTVFLCK